MNEPIPFDDGTQSDAVHYPVDKYLEQALIGQILISQSLDGLDELKPEDFYYERLQEIFARMRKLWNDGQPLDPYFISDRDDQLFALLVQCQAAPEPLTRADAYARKVRALAQKRRMIPVAQRVVQMSHNGVGPESIVDYLQDEIDKIRPELTTGNLFDRWDGQGVTAAEAAAMGEIERVYIVDDLVREQSLSIFYGAPGALKSALLMDLALCIANGAPWLAPLPVEGNQQRAFATKQARSLWLNYDQSHSDVLERLGAMSRAYGNGHNVTAISQSFPSATLTTESQARALGEYCARNGYKVLIVDSLLDVRGKMDLQESGMGDVLRLWRIVAESGNVCVILISHSTKQTQDLYGSVFLRAKCDHVYSVSRPPSSDVCVIESGKQRSFGETGKLFARWTYQHYPATRTLQTARFWGDSTESQSIAHPNSSSQSTILKILMASPGKGFSVNQLMALLNQDRDEKDCLKASAVHNAANRLVDNERNVGKSKMDVGNLYHYGELIHTE